jgi:hypothetical protein
MVRLTSEQQRTGGIRSGRQLSNFMESLCITGDKIN